MVLYFDFKLILHLALFPCDIVRVSIESFSASSLYFTAKLQKFLDKDLCYLCIVSLINKSCR